MSMVRPIRVVVLDDDASITRLVSKYLRKELDDRLAITTLNDSVQAKDWIDEHGCDLLLSDIEMPDFDGLEVLRFVKDRNAWTQVIFMTGRSTWDRINDAVENGASDYLIKPVQKDELLRVVLHECARITRWRSAVVETFKAAAL